MSTSWLEERFNTFEPPNIDEFHNRIDYVDKLVSQDGKTTGEQVFLSLKNGKDPLYFNIAGCRNPDTLQNMTEHWKNEINQNYEIDHSTRWHSGLWLSLIHI